MAIPTGMEAYLLQCAGDACSAVIGGVTTTFYGILDMVSSIQYDSAGNQVYVLGTHLNVTQGIASQLTRNQIITIAGQQYTLRDFQESNDPYVAVLELAKVTA